MEKGKLSPFQLFCLVFTFLLGSTTILQNLAVAGRDTWLSIILAVISGIIMALVTTSLALRFPNLTLIEYAQVLFGKILGRVIGALYLWYFLHLAALVVRNFGELMTSIVMPETPLWFFHLTLGLVVSFFVYHRVEVMGRFSELLFPIVILVSFLIVTLIALSGIVEINNFLPILEQGVGRVFMGAIPMASFPFFEIILFTMIFPYVNIGTNRRKAVLMGVTLSGILLLSNLVQDMAIFGGEMATLPFVRYSAIKLISVGDFIERIEAIYLAIILVDGLIKVGVCLYAFVLGLAQLLGLKDYKPLIMPSMIMMVVLSILVYENTFQMLDFAVNIYPVYAFPFQVGLPLLMLVLALIKRKGQVGNNTITNQKG